jgi:hypothetical protein
MKLECPLMILLASSAQHRRYVGKENLTLPALCAHRCVHLVRAVQNREQDLGFPWDMDWR